MTFTICKKCGQILDAFGCCPQVRPEDAARGEKLCSERAHDENCICTNCRERRQATEKILAGADG